MRRAPPLPFQADLDRLVRRLVARYTGGREALEPAEVGEVAWGVGELWAGFTGERALPGEGYLARRELLNAYMLYYLPRSYVQGRLALRHLRGRRVARVLDLGCGPGPLLLAARDAFGPSLELVGIDRDARALDLARELTGAQVFASKLPGLPREIPGRRFDLVTMGLVINELHAGKPDAVERRAGWIREHVWPLVDEGGHLVVVEPALRETSRQALMLRDRLALAGLRVEAPCARQGPCPALAKERDWCHAGLRFEAPAALRALGRAVGIDPADLRFTYLVFGPPVKPAAAQGEPLRVVSEPLVEKGRLKLWVCGERGRVLLDRQDKHRSEANAAMDGLLRDALVTVEGAEERADGLRATAQTRVTLVEPPDAG